MQAPSPKSCLVCSARELQPALLLQNIPVLCNELHFDRARALAAPRDKLDLQFCPHCGHLFNAAFDPARIAYSTTYENSLHYSPRFQAFATDLVDRLVATYALSDKQVIEIGAGQGDFLRLLCERGNNRGLGFDPSYVGESHEEASIQIIRDVYDERYAHYQADLVSCRHVLEHIAAPLEFLKVIRRALGGRRETVFYLEVPNGEYMVQQHAIWDLIYEHVSYFTPASLTPLLQKAGFEVLDIRSSFDGQYLSVESAPSTITLLDSEAAAPASLQNAVFAFATHFEQKTHEWRHQLEQLQKEEKKAVLWGAGSKGITFLNLMNKTGNIECAIDINPRKLGMYITGTGQRIESPAFLETFRPDAVIVMNAIYAAEIKAQMERQQLNPNYIFA